jgi:hypothetical protein
MKKTSLGLGLVVAATALAAACSGSLSDGGTGGKSSTSSGGATGLPCDLADVINAKCASCHSSPPTAGAPTPLLSASDLQAPAKTDPSVTMAVMSVKRMQAASAPMPPAGGATAADVAAFQKWIDAGYPQGDCGGNNTPDPAFSGPSVCTSNQHWTQSKCEGDPLMDPGEPCVDCHQTPAKYGCNDTGPAFEAAGTVYPTGHEPDACNGIDGPTMKDVVVHLVGADGVDHTAPVNAAGNFYYCSNTKRCPGYSGPLKLPYTAKVVSSKGERVMSEPQTSGDCNLCHTDAAGGNGSAAAGRVVVPY